MYLEYFGLRAKPFALECDLSRYYPAAHQETQNELLFSLEERQGLATLIGEPGTGKTTLLKNVLRLLGWDLKGVLLSDVSLSGGSLLNQLLLALNANAGEPLSPAGLQRALEDVLSSGRHVVLMVDEAQALSDRQLQEVQYVSNLESGHQKAVQMILAGQPDLEVKLEEPPFEALRQRVAVRSYLKPLTLPHTRAYVALRLQVSGARSSDLFPDESLVALHELSGGIPRVINLIADRALLIGYGDDARVIDEQKVRQAATELDLGSSSGKHLLRTRNAGRVEQRLVAIEQKLDSVLAALGRAGFLTDLDELKPARIHLESSSMERRATEARAEVAPELRSDEPDLRTPPRRR